MRKFALYYGVTRKGEREILGFGPRSEIQDLKAKCIKDLSDDKMCRKYKGLILATDYGLKNSYKPVHPEADKLALEEQEAAAKADQLAQDKALVDSKKKAASEKKAKDAQIQTKRSITQKAGLNQPCQSQKNSCETPRQGESTLP